MRIISNLGIKFNIIEDNFNIYENGIKYLPKINTSLAAQGALAHRLQRRTMPNKKLFT